MENSVTHENLTKNDVKVVVPLKHLSNFWRHLDIPLINCQVELILTWFKNCVLTDKSTREANYGANPVVYEIDNPENATFQITEVKLFVPVVTLLKENNVKLLEQLKAGFKRTIKWNKYRSQMTIQPKNNNLNDLIDPTFTNVNRLIEYSDNSDYTTGNLLDYAYYKKHYRLIAIDLSKQTKLKDPQ